MGFRWSGLLNMYFRSLYTYRSQLESTSSILLLSSSNRITLCTVRGLLAWSHKRHLFLVSQYGKMTSSCLFFSFSYIGYHVANVSSWSTTFPNNRFHLRRRAISSFDWSIWKIIEKKLGEISNFLLKYCKLDIKTLISSVKLQDTKSVYKNQLCFYKLTIRY